MKTSKNLALWAAALAISSFTAASAQVDTVPDYDENTFNSNTIQTYFTNHSLGYSGFVADITAAWNSDEGGVIDEFQNVLTGTSAFSTGNLISGYGVSGAYDPSGSATVGPNITFSVSSNSWTDTVDRANAISIDYLAYLKSGSQNTPIEASTLSGDPITHLGFTLLEITADKVDVFVQYTNSSSYSAFLYPEASQDRNCFFGAVAPAGESIKYFTITARSGNTVYFDDLAFSTVAVIPEPSIVGLSAFGLALLLRRRRQY